MFFSDNIPSSFSSVMISFLFLIFWRDFFIFAISNVEVLLNNPVGIGEAEHQDIQAVIEVELGRIADYHDKLDMLVKYFTKPKQTEEEQPQPSEIKDEKTKK